MKIYFSLFLFLLGIAFTTRAQSEVKIGDEVFSENYFTDLEKAKQQPEKVVYLDLSLQKLKKFPMEIIEFQNLEKLLLPFNYYPSIPEAIGKLDNVKVMDISGNYYMNHLPIEGLKDMESLEKIVVKDHRLAEGEIAKLKKELPGCTIVTD